MKNTLLDLSRGLKVGIVLILSTVVGIIQMLGILFGLPLCLHRLDFIIQLMLAPSH